MMSYHCDTIWPMRIDLSALECRQILREKELLCYSDVVSVFRAQGPLSEEKRSVLVNLQKILSISDERNKAEMRKAANNEKLATIAEYVSGFDGYEDWSQFGKQKFPTTVRPIPRTVFTDQATQTSMSFSAKEKDFPAPNETSDPEIVEKHEAAILINRILNKDRRPIKTETTLKASNLLSVGTMTTENNKLLPSQDLFKSSTKSKDTSHHDYNLHLLSEIATGESNQSDLMNDGIETNIKPDIFSIRHQINDIEEAVSSADQVSSSLSITPISARHHISTTTNILIPASTVVLSGGIKTLGSSAGGGTNHDHHSHHNPTNLSSSSTSAAALPVVISNSGQRYVLPRNPASQNINLITNNQQQKQTLSSFISQQQPTQQTQQQQQQQSSTFLTLTNNQMRSPPTQQLTPNWTNQSTSQQVFIQNVSHGIHQPMENLTSLGYTLQQRAVRAEQHQTNNKQNFIVRNLGNQPAMDAERNKRFMVVKGSGSLGPTTKKPKISNPSNRQPGRPPLMPAPSSAYTSRPYVANEIFHSNRSTINAVASTNSDSTTTDSNGLKVSSVTTTSRTVTPSASQMRPNSYYSVSRGNGIQRTSSTSSNSSSVVQLGSGSQIRTIETPSGATNSMRPKNVQPVISVVPLSPTITSSTSGNINKEDNNGHSASDKDAPITTTMPVKIITKDEVYANILDKVNPTPMVSLNSAENKTQ